MRDEWEDPLSEEWSEFCNGLSWEPQVWPLCNIQQWWLAGAKVGAFAASREYVEKLGTGKQRVSVGQMSAWLEDVCGRYCERAPVSEREVMQVMWWAGCTAGVKPILNQLKEAERVLLAKRRRV